MSNVNVLSSVAVDGQNYILSSVAVDGQNYILSSVAVDGQNYILSSINNSACFAETGIYFNQITGRTFSINSGYTGNDNTYGVLPAEIPNVTIKDNYKQQFTLSYEPPVVGDLKYDCNTAANGIGCNTAYIYEPATWYPYASLQVTAKWYGGHFIASGPYRWITLNCPIKYDQCYAAVKAGSTPILFKCTSKGDNFEAYFTGWIVNGNGQKLYGHEMYYNLANPGLGSRLFDAMPVTLLYSNGDIKLMNINTCYVDYNTKIISNWVNETLLSAYYSNARRLIINECLINWNHNYG